MRSGMPDYQCKAHIGLGCQCCTGVGPCLDVFGIFDGHGGKQIANYAAKNMMPALLKELSKGSQEEARGINIHSKHPHASQHTGGKLWDGRGSASNIQLLYTSTHERILTLLTPL